MTANKQQIIDLEKRFWQAMKDDDIPTAQSLLADDSLVTGPTGAMRISPKKFAQLSRESRFKIDKFRMSDVEVVFPSDDVAVIAYKIHETGSVKGKPMDLDAVDSTTWVRDGKDWKCALHTETIFEPERA